MNVLLVDDEADFLETLSKRLTRRGLTVFKAGNGREALEFLAGTGVDAVVLDVKMPGMSGLEVLREIKSRWPQTEVIMLSGHADVQVAVKGLEMGAFDYLMKPTDIEELLYKLQDAGKRRNIGENAAGSPVA
jgi:DNA-binding response OmpR family regulator